MSGGLGAARFTRFCCLEDRSQAISRFVLPQLKSSRLATAVLKRNAVGGLSCFIFSYSCLSSLQDVQFGSEQ
jgi:hypothetical protein